MDRAEKVKMVTALSMTGAALLCLGGVVAAFVLGQMTLGIVFGVALGVLVLAMGIASAIESPAGMAAMGEGGGGGGRKKGKGSKKPDPDAGTEDD